MTLPTKLLLKIGLYYPLRNLYWRMKYGNKSAESVFSQIYQSNGWQGVESVSGQGSDTLQTQKIITALPNIFKEYQVKKILDIPCGDFHWMKNVNLQEIDYLGGDIVDALVQANNRQYQSKNRNFLKLNLISDDLPQVDLIFCRDCLVHLCYADINDALSNICKSSATYVLMTTFTNALNRDIVTGDFRPLNFMAEPFYLPLPIFMLNEGCTESSGTHADKSLGLWAVDTIRTALNKTAISD